MGVKRLLTGENSKWFSLRDPLLYFSIFGSLIFLHLLLHYLVQSKDLTNGYFYVAGVESLKAVIYFAIAVHCFRMYRRNKILGWRFIGLAAAVWFPFQFVMGVLAFTKQDPLLSATAFYPAVLLSFVFAVTGYILVGLKGLSKRERIRIAINALSFGACISFIGIVFITEYILEQGRLNINEEIVNIVSFGIDVMFVSFALAVMLFRKFDRVCVYTGLSMILMASGDITFLFFHLRDEQALMWTRTLQITAMLVTLHAAIQKSGVPKKKPTVAGENQLTLGVNITVLATIMFALYKVPTFEHIPGSIQAAFVFMFVAVLLANLIGHFENKKLIAEREKSIVEISESEEKYQELATHDALTSLANRAFFIEELTKALHDSQEKDEQLAIFFIDLDRFKEINDTLGHSAGDVVIKEVANRIHAVVGEQGLVSRLGGDEFSVLVPSPAPRDLTFDIASNILNATIKPLDIAGSQAYLSCSIGIAFSGEENNNPQELLRNADIAMYKAKEMGRNRIEYADEVVRVAPKNAGWSLSDLRKAIKENEIVVYYQPIYTLDTEKLFGFEALARWEHPELGVISPEEFITVAEDNGLIIDLGNSIVEQSFAQLSKWHAVQRQQGSSLSVLHINLSFRQLNEKKLLEELLSACGRHGVDPTLINIEMTESALLGDVRNATTTLKEITSHGFSLHIDDFGTGYSSLSYLKKFPVSGFKIDKAFVLGYGSNEDDTAIVDAMIALGKSMNLVITAEGVQSKDVRDKLADLGCTFGQGYFYSEAKSADQVILPKESGGDLSDTGSALAG